VYTLPAPRYSYYEATSYQVTQNAVGSEIDKLQTALGFYPIFTEMYLLYEMQLLSYGILLLGLIFDIILILLVIVSVLLIYSLLMITVEHKTFESGIMRLIGLTKAGYVSSIFMQASLFVLPSIVCAFLASAPALYYIFKKLISSEISTFILPIPSLEASHFQHRPNLKCAI
jgi:ABC-type antimicrobial peptide transport system permease subunit